MNPTWFEVARRPKYILGLALALLIAIIFSLLGQWQLSRTFQTVGIENVEQTAVPIESLITPGEPIAAGVLDRLVTANVQLDLKNIYVVENRLQLLANDTTQSGYWLVANSSALVGEEVFSLTLALAFSSDLETVERVKSDLQDSIQAQAFLPIQGLIEPSEAPKESSGADLLGSLSLAELVNIYSPDPIVTFPAYLIVTDGWTHPDLESIKLRIQQEQTTINWLTAFYALEWAFFALAAFYIWWRIVMDEVLRLRESNA